MNKKEKIKLLQLHGFNDERNEHGVKDQDNAYRIKSGIFYRAFDVYDGNSKEELKKIADEHIIRNKDIGLKCFKEWQDDSYYRIFYEEKLDENEVNGEVKKE